MEWIRIELLKLHSQKRISSPKIKVMTTKTELADEEGLKIIVTEIVEVGERGEIEEIEEREEIEEIEAIEAIEGAGGTEWTEEAEEGAKEKGNKVDISSHNNNDKKGAIIAIIEQTSLDKRKSMSTR